MISFFYLEGLELILFIAKDGGLKFTDTGIAKSDWPTLKAQTPYGQVPILIEKNSDGTELVIPQSMSIVRHLARVTSENWLTFL